MLHLTRLISWTALPPKAIKAIRTAAAHTPLLQRGKARHALLTHRDVRFMGLKRTPSTGMPMPPTPPRQPNTPFSNKSHILGIGALSAGVAAAAAWWGSVKPSAANLTKRPDVSTLFTLVDGEYPYVKQQLARVCAALRAQSTDHLRVEVRRGDTTVAVRPQDLQIGDTAFVPIGLVRPLQCAISYYGILVNLYLKASKTLAYAPLKFDDGRAVAPLTQAKDAVVGPDGNLYLLDGHHSHTGALLSEATTCPLRIREVFKDMTMQEFMDILIAKKWAYLTDFESSDGKRLPLMTGFDQLLDSHFRGKVDAAGAEVTADEVRCEYAHPAWVRTSEIPFIEFDVAHALVKAGLTRQEYPNLFKGGPLTPEDVETLRRFMLQVRSVFTGGNHPLHYTDALPANLMVYAPPSLTT